MSVIGIDLGHEYCYVAVAKAGGIETIANDYSLRATPSFIAFSEKNRILGVAAKNQQVTNMKNTVYGLKRLLGRKFKDPHVQKEIQHLPFNVIEDDTTKKGNIGIKVNYLNEEQTFSPEQCLAMLLTKLKDIASTALQTPVSDCVISVPSYFTNNERLALRNSAAIAGLNVLRLFNETTATALSYGIYKQDLPAAEEKPRNIVFVDCGHSSLQVSVCAFHKGKLKMLSAVSDSNLGGRDFDLLIADQFVKQFQTKYNIDARSNPRAFVRLLAEAEKIKKQMSANSTTLPLNIECFMNDKDVSGEMKRADMEAFASHLLQRVENTLRQGFAQSGLTLEDVHSVEIVGGSSRIPAIKQLIEKVFGKVPSTTLNQDEAVARGCALQCAMLSPTMKVREFSVTDVQTYPISVSWDASTGGEGAGEVELFPANHQVPFSKLLTFYRGKPFKITARYNGPIPYPDPHICTWNIMDFVPDDGTVQKVKVKVKVNRDGITTVSSAYYEGKKSAEDAAEEQQAQKQGVQQNNVDGPQQDDTDTPMDTGNGNALVGGGSAAPEDGDKDKKKKQTVKNVLTIEWLTSGLTPAEIKSFAEQELKMIAYDKQEKERADARNAFEEYIYDLRSKVSGDGEFAPFILKSDSDALVIQLDDMENWLYEDGEDCNKQVYIEKLAQLKAIGEPVQTRKIENELRPVVIEDFAKSLQLCMKALDLIKSKDPKYAHLTSEDISKLEESLYKTSQWLDQTRAKVASAPKHLPPPVTVAQIRQEKAAFDRTVNAILNKPAPKAPSPPKEEKPAPPPSSEPQQQKSSQKAEHNSEKLEENMEWSATN